MAKKKSDQQPVNASAVSLFRDVAIDQFFLSLMFGSPDMDARLQELGIARQDLRKLEYDDEIAAHIETRREAVISTPWHIEPQNGEAPDSDPILFLYSNLEPHIERILRCAWAAVPYGYSVGEAVYRIDEMGRYALDTLSEKPFEWFTPNYDGSLLYNSPVGGITDVDRQFKFLLTVRNPTYRQPRGDALFSRLYSAWFYRTHGWRFWMHFLERVGIPFLVGTTKGKPADMATDLNKAVQGGTIALPDGDAVQLLASSMTGDAFSTFDVGVSKRIQKLILGQTLTSDTQGVGSQALGRVHNEVREDRRNSDIRMCKQAVQWIINALWLLNGFSGVPAEFCMEDDTGLQSERADRDTKLVNAGVLKLTNAYLLRTYDYEEGDFEIPTAPDHPQVPPALADQQKNQMKPMNDQAQAAAGGFAFAAASKFTPQQQALEDLAQSAGEAGEQPLDEDIIRVAVKAARSPEDLEQRFAALLGKADSTLFQRYLERGLFAADVLGYVHADGK